jgi:hypothetical protein
MVHDKDLAVKSIRIIQVVAGMAILWAVFCPAQANPKGEGFFIGLDGHCVYLPRLPGLEDCSDTLMFGGPPIKPNYKLLQLDCRRGFPEKGHPAESVNVKIHPPHEPFTDNDFVDEWTKLADEKETPYYKPLGCFQAHVEVPSYTCLAARSVDQIDENSGKFGPRRNDTIATSVLFYKGELMKVNISDGARTGPIDTSLVADLTRLWLASFDMRNAAGLPSEVGCNSAEVGSMDR